MSQHKFLLKRLANISFLSKIRIICYKMQFSLQFRIVDCGLRIIDVIALIKYQYSATRNPQSDIAQIFFLKKNHFWGTILNV
ncbi:MAG: hypothetical protein RIS64_2157 [Bacteroidota bacterium]|jgi:hypothetical protein